MSLKFVNNFDLIRIQNLNSYILGVLVSIASRIFRLQLPSIAASTFLISKCINSLVSNECLATANFSVLSFLVSLGVLLVYDI